VANPNPYTSTSLLNAVKLRGQIPEASEDSFDDTDLLDFLSEEIQTYMASLLMSVREEFFVHAYDVAAQNGLIFYDVPPRSIGGKLRQVLLGTPPSQWVVIQRIEPKQLYGAYYGYSNSYSGYAIGYIFQDTTIELLSPFPNGQTIRMMYFRRPNRLVADSACAAVTALGPAANQVTVSAATLPSSFTTSVTYDLIKGTPGFKSLGDDVTVTNVNTSTGVITFTDNYPSSLQVGDFVCLSGTSCVPQIPVEMHPLLAQRVVVKVLEAMGDPKVVVAKQMCEEQRLAAVTLLEPRSEGDSRYLTNFNAPGWGGRWRRY
jgi:hypothetical protein